MKRSLMKRLLMREPESASAYFFDRLNEHGNKIAVIENDKLITYSELQYLLDKRKSEIVSRCGKHKQVLGLVANNTLATLVNYLSILQLRHVVLFFPKQVVIDGITPDTFWENSLVNDYQVTALLHEKAFEVKVTANKGRDKPEIRDDLALLLNTSGSTGASKQVMISYANIEANTQSICDYLPIQDNDISISTLPFHYSYGLSIIHTHLACGAALLMTEYSAMQREYWTLFNKYGVTSFGGVPHSYDMLLRLKFNEKKLPSLRYFTQAGGKLAASKVTQLAEYAKEHNKAFFVMYGQTEATARMSFATHTTLLLKPETIGKAIPRTRFYIEDSKGSKVLISASDEQLMPNERQVRSGELIFEGANVMLGYAHSVNDFYQQEATSAHEQIAAPHFLSTGDLARVDEDGDIFITGRIKRMIKLLGERISLDELENRLQQKIDNTVQAQYVQCVCVGNDKKLTLVLAGQASNNVEDLIDELKSELKSMNIRAQLVDIRVIPSLPRTENEKVDYAVLLKMMTDSNLMEGRKL